MKTAQSLATITAGILLTIAAGWAAADRPNIMLITADDLGYEVINCTGGTVPGVTPNLDRLAAQGIRFDYAHVNYAICAPSRSIIATGRYGHASGLFGFNKFKHRMPTVFGELQNNGYLTGVLGKVGHSTPDMNFSWDYAVDYQDLGAGRSPSRYYRAAREFIEGCKERGKPFYLMANSHDPHRPFHDPAGKGGSMSGAEQPSRLFSADEVVVPPYLVDLPAVRTELSHYYNSVRRLDDTVGRLLQALEDAGVADNTLVLFMTDNGSAFPFAKANVYLASTRTPCFVRWPGVVKPGTVDSEHMISEVDWFPSFMEAAGIPAPGGLQGRSIIPLLRGEKQAGRDFVFTEIDYLIGGPARPMRAVQGRRYGYIFNAWGAGGHAQPYRNNNEGMTMRAMETAAQTDPRAADRVELYRNRVPEEFYDLEKDPGCTHNLIASPEHRERVREYRGKLERLMKETDDHCLPWLERLDDPEEMAKTLPAYPRLDRPEKERGARKQEITKPGWQN